MIDNQVHQLLSDVSDDFPDLDRVRRNVRDQVGQQARGQVRRRRGAALGLTAAAVLAVCAGIFLFPHSGQSGPAGPVTPTQSSTRLSSTASQSVTGSGASSATGLPSVSFGVPLPLSSTQSSSSPLKPTGPPAISASPAFGTKNLAPAQAISISVRNAAISDLTVAASGGKAVKGVLSADRTSWKTSEVLGFGQTYTVTGTATGTDGHTLPIEGTYSTVGAATKADAAIEPADGEVVGIAEPIIIRFPVEPIDKAAIEQALTVTTTPTVEGSWGWVQHDSGWGVDWRPKGYWPAGTKVHVSAQLYGMKLAAGQYAATDLSSDFTIGRSQVVYADAASSQIVVKQGCTAVNDPASCAKTVATYPATFGSRNAAGDPNRVIRSGVHVVNELLQVNVTINAESGSGNATKNWNVRISNNGEFIQQSQGTAADQGGMNGAPGGIYLSAGDAKAYFESVLIGDPVEVTGTSVALSATDGDLFDWTIPWSQWQQRSAR